MEKTKKQRRIHALYKQFSELCTEIPSNEYQVWEDTGEDPPDVSVGENELGIEFVDFVHGWNERGGSSIKATEVHFNAIVRAAKELYELNNSQRLWVNFHWIPHRKNLKIPKYDIVQAIVEILVDELPFVESKTTYIDHERFSDTVLFRLLNSMRIYPLKENQSVLWTNSQAGFVGVEAQNLNLRHALKNLL